MNKELFGEVQYDQEGKVTNLKLRNVILNYVYLDMPRPEDEYNDGKTRMAEVLLSSPEHVALYTEYFGAAYKQVAVSRWGGQQYQDIFLPHRTPKPNTKTNEIADIEKGVQIIIKGVNGFEVPLFDRSETTGVVTQLTGGAQADAFYSGVLADVVIKIDAYDKKGARKAGMKAYLNSACRVGVGKPQMQAVNFADEFATSATPVNEFTLPKNETVAPVQTVVEPAGAQISAADMLANLNTTATEAQAENTVVTPNIKPAGDIPEAREPLNAGPIDLNALLKK